MRKTHFALLGLLLAAAIVVGITRVPARVHAQTASGCDATTLNSAYGYVQNGFAYDSRSYLYVHASNGRNVGDGNGNLTGSDTINFDGTVYRRTITGTYTLNADCTGTINLAYSDNTGATADIVVVNDGKTVNVNQTDPDFINSGSWTRISQPAAAVTPDPPADSAARSSR
ncbi:MAG: hypothetical protein ABI823_21825 [Bryobacteraceae bacterium]